ncbi:hypothetical protein MBLNU457_5771t1 [Dothideomycetes sp. NU457]
MSNPIASILAAIQTLQNVNIAFIVVATVPTFLRFYVRGFMTRTFGPDDWAMVACWASYIVCAGLAFMLREQLDLIFTTGHIPDHIGMILKVNTSFYILTMTLLKVSLGLFFLNIFTRRRSWQRYVIHAIIWFSVLYGIINIGFSLGTCGPEKLFGATCKLRSAYSQISISWSSINIITDFMLAALTIQAIWTAHLPIPTKITASAVLALGTMGGVASIVRIILISLPNGSPSQGLGAAYWSLIEASIGIAAASFATLRPLFRSCMEGVQSKGSTNKATTNAGSRVPTALRSRHMHTVHDWRDDRIEMGDIEKGVMGPKMNTNILASTTVIVEEEKLGDVVASTTVIEEEKMSDAELETKSLVA